MTDKCEELATFRRFWPGKEPDLVFYADDTVFYADATRVVATISPDGIMRFAVDPTDENAAKFVACIEAVIGRRLNGIEVT